MGTNQQVFSIVGPHFDANYGFDIAHGHKIP